MAKKKKKSSTPKPLSQKQLQTMLAQAEGLQQEVTQNLAATETAYNELTTTPAADSYYVRDPKTGLSPAQLEARGFVKEAAQAATDVGIQGKVVTPKGSAGQFIEKPEVPPADANFRYDYQWVGASTGTNIGSYKLVKYPNTGPADWQFDSNGILFNKGKLFTGNYQGIDYVNGRPPGYKEVGGDSKVDSSTDAATLELIKSLQKQVADLSTGNQQAAIDKAAADAAGKQEKAENAIAVLTDRFTKYNLASLIPRIKQLAISGASESTITLQLQESEEYKTRFKANQDRIKKGLRVLDPSDYLNLEDDYRQILRAYGLKAFDNDNYVTQFISNDISTTELSNRVVTAVQRVQNADPAILTTLRSFYGITDNDLVAYVLDPNQQFQKIERQVAAAEIGAAAGLQGLNIGSPVAEQLAAQGVTKAQAQKGYSTIADSLPTAEKLSSIYDKALPSYGLAEAEQDVFNTLASAQRKRRALAEREAAEFSGTSALSKSSLSRQLGGQY